MRSFDGENYRLSITTSPELPNLTLCDFFVSKRLTANDLSKKTPILRIFLNLKKVGKLRDRMY